MELAELAYMMAVLMKKTSIVIMLPRGPFSDMEDRFRACTEETWEKGAPTDILLIFFFLLWKIDIVEAEQM